MKIRVQKVLGCLISIYEDIMEIDEYYDFLQEKIDNIKEHLKMKKYDKNFIINILIEEKSYLDELIFSKLDALDIEIIHDDLILLRTYYDKIIHGEINYE